jgi:hypothetical protein
MSTEAHRRPGGAATSPSPLPWGRGWVAARPAACPGPDRAVGCIACGLDPHIFRAMRHNARGLRAGGLVAVLGGLRARRERRATGPTRSDDAR